MPNHGDGYEMGAQQARSLGGLTGGPKSERSPGRLAELQSLVAEIDGRLGEASGRIHSHLDRIGAPSPTMESAAEPGGLVPRDSKDLPVVDQLSQQLITIRRQTRELEYLASRLEQL